MIIKLIPSIVEIIVELITPDKVIELLASAVIFKKEVVVLDIIFK